MGDRRLIGVQGGIARYWDYDPSTGDAIESAVQDVEPHLEASRAAQNNPDYWKKGVKDEFAHYAHIPNILLERWALQGVDINNPSALIEMCNKPEYSYLKTTTAVVRARG